MLFVLCEDRRTGYRFVKEIFKRCFKDCNIKVDTADGCKNIIGKVLRENLKKGDALFLFFDNVSNNESTTILNNLNQDSNLREYEFYYTKYYSFEELVLGFKDFYKWVNIDISGPKSPMYNLSPNFINNCYRNIYNYIWDRENNIDYFYDKNIESFVVKKEKETKEQYCKKILRYYSEVYRNGMTIDDIVLLKCWYEDCDKISLRKDSDCYYCINNWCYFHKNPLYLKGNMRLEYFWKHSLLEYKSLSFEDLKKLVKRCA